jgi:di/tricarboxylate transporter
MSLEGVVVIGLVFVAVALFASEKLPVDLVGLLIMATLMVSGIVTPEEGLAGFSSTATVTVAAMFILSAGLFKSGALNFVGSTLILAGKRNFWIAVTMIMLAAAAMSAFINNTAVVAIFIPIVLETARRTKVSPARLLMPLSFASMFGGVCTLIGTSTNILLSSIAERSGVGGFQMFDFSSLGIVFLAAGVLYMLLVGIRLLPSRRASGGLLQDFEMADYVTEIILMPEARSVGTALSASPLVKDVELAVLEVIREGERLGSPPPDLVLQAHDVLRVRCNVSQLNQLRDRMGIVLRSERKLRDSDMESEETVLVEAVIAPNSFLSGNSIRDTRFRSLFDATVLAIRHRGEMLHEVLESIRLAPGDALLFKIRKEHLTNPTLQEAFVVVSQLNIPKYRKSKILPAIAIIAGIVIVAALNIVPIVVSAICGCILMVLTRCITLDEAYRSVEWRVIFLLAGVLTLGIALEKTGAARVLADLLISTVGILGPVAVVSALYLLTSLLTEAMSNNATAALLGPIAISTAQGLDVDPLPFLMAVAFAASASFMTPVGYQTNTMIYGPGQFKFTDFVRVGAPLNVLFWVLSTVLIPYFFPF